MSTNLGRLPASAVKESAASRTRLAEVWDVIRPELLFHGHIHAPGGGATDDGRRVVSLGKDTQQRNLAILDMGSLTMQTPALQHIRDAAER